MAKINNYYHKKKLPGGPYVVTSLNETGLGGGYRLEVWSEVAQDYILPHHHNIRSNKLGEVEAVADRLNNEFLKAFPMWGEI